MKEQDLWERCAAFHGHTCGGLAIGFRAALYAAKRLGLTFSADEEVVCVSENDACGVDAIQVLLGCSLGKGNLLLRPRGKQVFTFFNRKTGEGLRLALKEQPALPRDQREQALRTADDEALFSATPPAFALPESARIFVSRPCAHCGESTAEPYLRVQDGELLCLDCVREPRRVGSTT